MRPARVNASIKQAIATIDEDARTAIRYPKAVWDTEGRCWVSDAEIAEVEYTAFTSKTKKQQVTARLIVRRVKRLNPDSQVQCQGELFSAYRYHRAFTDSPLTLVDAEKDHRRHVIVEPVIAGVKSGPPAHLPSGDFQANAAVGHWLLRAPQGALARPGFPVRGALGVRPAASMDTVRRVIGQPHPTVWPCCCGPPMWSGTALCGWRRTARVPRAHGPGPGPRLTCWPSSTRTTRSSPAADPRQDRRDSLPARGARLVGHRTRRGDRPLGG